MSDQIRTREYLFKIQYYLQNQVCDVEWKTCDVKLWWHRGSMLRPPGCPGCQTKAFTCPIARLPILQNRLYLWHLLGFDKFVLICCFGNIYWKVVSWDLFSICTQWRQIFSWMIFLVQNQFIQISLLMLEKRNCLKRCAWAFHPSDDADDQICTTKDSQAVFSGHSWRRGVRLASGESCWNSSFKYFTFSVQNLCFFLQAFKY